MKKPWEETWEFSESPGEFWVVRPFDFGPGQTGVARILSEDRAKIASVAPEAIRLLLAAEWAGCCGVCIHCGAYESEGHDTACPFEALMRKAGVR